MLAATLFLVAACMALSQPVIGTTAGASHAPTVAIAKLLGRS